MNSQRLNNFSISVLFALLSYGAASLAIDRAYLWAYAITFISLGVSIRYLILVFKKQSSQ